MPKPRVLLLIGNADEAEMYGAGLSPHFQVEVATAADDRRVREADLVVADDVGEAAEPAWEVLEAVCGTADHPPVVLLTAHIHADRRVRDRAASLGCAGYVAKPCTPEALGTVLRRILGGERGIEHIRGD